MTSPEEATIEMDMFDPVPQERQGMVASRGPDLPPPAEIPRSFRESPNYTPDWRSSITSFYYSFASENGVFNIEDVEDDPMIQQYYNYRTRGICTTPGLVEAINYAEACQSGNATHGIATRIRALTLVGIDDEEIADSIMCKVDHIRVFQSLFFDVKDYLSHPHVIRAIVLGPDPSAKNIRNMEDGTETARDRVACAVALSGDLTQLEYILNPTTKFDEDAMEKMTRDIAFMTASRAHERAVLDSSSSTPAKAASYLFIEQAKVRAIERQTDLQAENSDKVSMDEFGRRLSELWANSDQNDEDEDGIIDIKAVDEEDGPRKKVPLALQKSSF